MKTWPLTSAAAGDASFVDLDYRELVASPAEALSVVYRAAHMEPPADLTNFVDTYQVEHPPIAIVTATRPPTSASTQTPCASDSAF